MQELQIRDLSRVPVQEVVSEELFRLRFEVPVATQIQKVIIEASNL